MQMVLPPLSTAPTSTPEHALAMFFERPDAEPAPSPSESAHRSLIQFAAGRFGARILGASDRADLDVRVDLVVEDADFWTALALASRSEAAALGRTGDRPKRDVEKMVSRMAGTLGAGMRPQIELGLALCLEIERAAKLLNQARGMAQMTVPATPASGEHDFLSFLYSPEVHSEIGRRLLDGCRAGALSFAIVQMGILANITAGSRSSSGHILSRATGTLQRFWAHRETKPVAAPWLVLGVVERWVATLRSFLQIYASLPGSLVPEALIPVNERLDLNRLHAEVQAREAFFAETIQRGAQGA